MEKPDKKRKEGKQKRWTATRKLEIVLRCLRGEAVDEVSREVGVTACEIEGWQQRVLRGGEEHLKSRVGDPLGAELDAAKKRIGELSMENELLKEKEKRKGVFQGGRWRK